MNLSDKTFFNIIAKSLGAIFLLISSVVMVRYLSKGDYGTFLQIILISNTVTMLSFMGLPHSIYYFYPQTSRKAGFIKQTLFLAILISLLTSIVAYFLNTTIASLLNNPEIMHYSVVISLMILFDGPLSFSESVFFAQRMLKLSFFSNIIFALISYLPLFAGMYFGLTLNGLMIVFLVSKGTIFLIFFAMMYYSFRFINVPVDNTGSYKKVGILEQLKYALPLGVASHIGIVSKEIDKYFISFFFTPVQFAVYSRGAMQIPLISNLQFVINDIRMVDYVRCFKANRVSEFLGIMHSAIDKVAKINFAVFFFLFANATLLIKLLYTEQYLNAVPIFRVYLITLVISITVYNLVPRASGHTRITTYATVIGLVANIMLSPVLIYLCGPVGAAVATIVTLVIMVAYYLILSAKILRIKFFHIMPWFPLFRVLMASLISVIPVYFLQFILALKSSCAIITFLGLSFGFYVYFYLVCMSVFGLMYDDDWQFLRRRLRFDVSKIVPCRVENKQ